jgi:hypothetical protein
MAWTGQSRIGRTLTLPRMNAHRLVIVAAALTTLVAAALGTTFAVFSGQALPRAVRATLAAATGTAVDFSGAMTAGQAGQYTTLLRRQVGAALDGGPFAFYQARWSDPLGFTSGSGPAASSGGNVPIAEAAALTGLSAHAVLTAGTWPGPPGRAGAGRPAPPVPAALPDAAAGLLHVRPGGTLTLRDRETGRLTRFRITGLYRQAAGPAAAYWGLNQIGASSASTSSGYTTYGPLAVSPAAFGASGPLTVGSATWVVQPEAAAIPASQLGPVAARLTALRQSVQSPATLPSLTVTTQLPAVLTGTQSDLRVARSLLAVCAVLVALLAATALLVVARLLAGQREGESAMLVARGATRWQLTRLTLAEAVPLCLVAAAVGGLAGVALAKAGTGAGPVPLTAAVASAWPIAAIIAAGAVLILLAPVLRTVNPGTARVRRGRQAALAGFSRAGLDVALVVLAVLAGLELRRYSAVSPSSSGGNGVDPVLVAAPALALAGGAVAALRLLPLGGKVGDRLAARSRRLTAALASWQISRQPIRQGGAVLLIVLAVATAGLVLAQRDSWTRSDHDQAAFTAGADVRVQPAEPLTAGQAGRLSRTPGVRRAMPVATSPAITGSGETVALDVRQAAAVTLLRADQLPRAAGPLFAAITPAGPAASLALPGHPVRVAIAASIGPASLPLAPVTVTVTVQDDTGDAYSLPAGTLPADARTHTLTAVVPGGGAVYPLRVTAITAAYTLPARSAADKAGAVFSVTGLSGGPGQAPVAGTALSRWQAQASSAELASAQAEFPGVNGPVLLPAVAGLAAASGATQVTFQAGYGQIDGDYSATEPTLPVTGQLTLTAARRSATPIPGLATRGYLTANHASVGSVVQVGVGGTNLAVKIIGAVASFPTVPLSGGAVIVDLAAVQDRLASQSLSPVQASQWWLATAGGRPPPQLAGRLPAGTSVTSASTLTESLLNDPVSAVPRHALLAVALAAVLLAITGFVVSIAAGVRQRRAENALLAALGVPPAAAARQLSLENLMLSVPSALAGLALGVVLAELLVPAITLTTTATIPVPPVLIEFGWPLTLVLATAVAVAPVLAAAVTLARRPDPAAALRTAEAT